MRAGADHRGAAVGNGDGSVDSLSAQPDRDAAGRDRAPGDSALVDLPGQGPYRGDVDQLRTVVRVVDDGADEIALGVVERHRREELPGPAGEIGDGQIEDFL